MGEGCARCTAPLPSRALRPLARSPGPSDELLPASFLPRALHVLRLGGRVVCRTRPDAMPGFAALSQRVRPGRLTEFVWDRLIQWARYLVLLSGLLLTLPAVVSVGPAPRAPLPEPALFFNRRGAPARAASAAGGMILGEVVDMVQGEVVDSGADAPDGATNSGTAA